MIKELTQQAKKGLRNYIEFVTLLNENERMELEEKYGIRFPNQIVSNELAEALEELNLNEG